MNYLLSILFLVIILFFYYIIGNYVIRKNENNTNSFAKKLLCGFIITFFLGFIVGFPCQLFSTSWYLFAIIYSIILLSVFAFCIVKTRTRLLATLKIIRQKPLWFFRDHLKEYWFIYLMTIVFTLFSMMNLQPYTLSNYNDDYYIVKVVHLSKSAHLLGENYFYGNSISTNLKLGVKLFQNYRIYNTFELVYSYFGTIFHIDLAFFCRCTMTFHNYLFVFFSYQLLSGLFFDRKTSQYSLAVFTIFLIPAGYLAKAKPFPNIRMFETWRIQTGMYLGGSITRLMSLPLFLCLLNKFTKKWDRFSIIEVLVVTVFLISFQTTGISYLLLIIPVFIVSKVIACVITKKKVTQKPLILLIIMSIIVVLYAVSDGLLNDLIINNSLIQNFLSNIGLKTKLIKSIEENYQAYYLNIMYYDVVAKYGFIPLTFLMFIVKDKYQKITLLSILMIYLIFKVNKSNVFLSLISFDFYCTARMLTACLMVTLLVTGIFIIALLKQFNIKQHTLVLITSSVFIGMISYININKKEILKYAEPGDAVIRQGYSYKTLTANDKMLAPMFVEVAQYINSLPQKKYAIYSPKSIQYKGMKYSDQNLIMASSKIKHLYYLVNKNTFESIASNDAQYVLDAYLKNQCSVEYTLPFISKAKLHYLFITNKQKKDELCKNGFTVKAGNDEKGYYLLYCE